MMERICGRFSKKAMALLLAVCMVISMSPPFAVAAEASNMDSGAPILLSGFAALAKEVREQSVPIGTSLAELKLPDTLEAAVRSAWEDADTQPPAEPPVEAPEPETPAPSRPQDSGTVETPSAPEETSEPRTPEEPAPPADEAESADGSEPATRVLAAYVQSDIAQAKGEAASHAAVTVEGVTWESAPAYDGETAGTYIFTAILPSGYILEDSTSLPTITVAVAKAELSAVDKVIAMIDALPSYAELTAEPPAEGTPEYEAWLAKTRQTLADITAAKAAYDTLSVEDKAKVDEAHKAKLTELFELAEGMASMMPMVPVAAFAPTVDIVEKEIFANGTEIKIEATDLDYNWRSNILYDINGDGTIGATEWLKIGDEEPTAEGYDLRQYEVYGGTNGVAYTGNTKITYFGGNTSGYYNTNNISDTYGGCKGADMVGDTEIIITGGEPGPTYGGGYKGKVTGDTHITVSDTGAASGLYGGGNNDYDTSYPVSVDGSTYITVSSIVLRPTGTIGVIYGGAFYGRVTGNTNIVVGGDTTSIGATGEIVGGGVACEIGGNANITITGGTFNKIDGGGDTYNRYDGKYVQGTTNITITGASVADLYGGYGVKNPPSGGNVTLGAGVEVRRNGIYIGAEHSGYKDGVDSFKIDPTLTGEDGCITVWLTADPDEFMEDAIIATNASAGDVAKIELDLRSETALGKELYFDDSDKTIKVRTIPNLEEKPAIAINYATAKLTGFADGAKYTINEADVTLEADGTLVIDDEWFGTDIHIIRKASDANHVNSVPQKITIPRRPPAPTPSAVGETTPGAKDGMLTGVSPNTKYQISSDSGTNWIEKTSENWEGWVGAIYNIAPGTYIVRLAPTGSAFASLPSQKVTVDGETKTDISAKLSVTIAGWVYGDTAKTPTIAAEGITLDQSKAAYTYSGTADNGTSITNSATPPTLPGTYTASAKYEDDMQKGTATSGSFTITKAKLTITGGTVKSRDYIAGDKTATVTAVTFGGLKNGETLAIGTDYTVTASFEDDKAGAKKPVTGTVALKPTSATAANYTLPSGALSNIFGSITGGPKTDISAKLSVTIAGWAYGDTAKTPTVAAEGGIILNQSKAAYTYSGTADNGTIITDSTTAPSKAGSYTVTAKYEDDTQKGTATSGSFTITKAPLTITGGTVKSRGYIAGDKTATVTAVTFGGLKNGETLAIGTDYTVTDAQFIDANVGINKPVTAKAALVATAKTANYTLLNSALDAKGTITKEADGTKNPDYANALAELKKVHIITNATPTLETVILPEGWSFTGDKTAKLTASNDNGGKQNFAVMYTSKSPNYPDVAIAAQPFPVSTVSVAMSKLEVVVIDTIGGTESLSATVTVTGAALSGDLAVTGMEWRSSCPEIVSLSGASMGGTASVTAKGDKKGISMVGVAYKGGDMLGYVLVKVIDNRDDSSNTIDQIKDIADTLDKLVDKDKPTAGDKGAVNAVADEVTKLPEAAKEALTKDDVAALDGLKKQVNDTLTINIDETPEGTAPPAPTGVSAVGTAIACGVESGTVTYYVTPVAPTGTGTKLELKLEMKVGGSKEQLKAPLFFTMTMPSDVEVSKLKIKHVMESGSEEVEFTASGQSVSFKLNSFSGLQFIVENGTTPPPPAETTGGSSSGGPDDGQNDFWERLKDKIDKADDGEVIKVGAGGYDKLPESVIDALRKNPDVTLVIDWNGGDDITIPAGMAQKTERGRVYWPLSLLAELYGGITFVEAPPAKGNANPETGGPGYIACADGKTIPVTGAVTELDAPLAAVDAPAKAPQITPPTAGFEPDAYAGTPDVQAASGGAGLWLAVTAAMLAAAGIDGFLWKKRPARK